MMATPPWIQAQAKALLQQRGHAWLLSGPSGLGQYGLGMALVRAWLCENVGEMGACGQCASCHAIDVRTHADLCVLMPETRMLELGWPLGEKAQSDIDDKKRKPSKEIRVEALRDAIEFSQRTSARGRGKAVLVYPAEDMNAIAANALLKTLEEPPGDVKFVLASESAHQLLPTIRSRCLAHGMQWPDTEAARAWLMAQGVEAKQAGEALIICGQRPEDALAWAQSGRDATLWAGFAKAMARGDVAYVRDWSGRELLDAQHKLCHDLLALAVNAPPRFFAPQTLCEPRSVAALTRWNQQLNAHQRTVDHPFNAGLLLESLVCQAQHALSPELA